MIELLIFLLGWVWTMIGMQAISIIDPEGQYDELTMGRGKEPSIVKFGIAILFWPITEAIIRYRRKRP